MPIPRLDGRGGIGGRRPEAKCIDFSSVWSERSERSERNREKINATSSGTTLHFTETVSRECETGKVILYNFHVSAHLSFRQSRSFRARGLKIGQNMHLGWGKKPHQGFFDFPDF